MTPPICVCDPFVGNREEYAWHNDRCSGDWCRPLEGWLLCITPQGIENEKRKVEAMAEGLSRSDGTVTGGDAFTHRIEPAA